MLAVFNFFAVLGEHTKVQMLVCFYGHWIRNGGNFLNDGISSGK